MITLAEIKTQLTELYLSDGYTFDEAHEMISEGDITWKGKRGCIQHVNGKIDQFKITEVISWIEENVYTDPFVSATEWITEEQVCAPAIKANNHKQDPIMRISNMAPSERRVLCSKEHGVKEFGVRKSYPYSHFVTHEWKSEVADQTPESFMHQVFIDYTNENTNRV